MSKRFGFLFPGQGAQFVGMGADLYDKYPEAKDTYDRATDVLEFDIRSVSFEGPEEKLRQTNYTQPAILVHSLAVLSVLKQVEPRLAAGHSLGEYSALYAAGSLDFDSVVRLVRRRAELMGAEGEKNPGTMAAIVGLDSSVVEELCREAGGVVVCANYNEPKQTVVSGEIPAVKRVAELAPGRGALKAIMLPVSGAFHSPLLENSAKEFAEFLAQFSIGEPRCPVIANVTGKPVSTAAEIRECLAAQLRSPVRWVDTMASCKELGCREFIEAGPGKVLAGLARRIDRELTVAPVGTADQVAAILAG